MALNELEQIKNTIDSSRQILITFAKDCSIDAIASALALYLALKKMNKLVDIVCADFTLPKNLKFLPATDQIQSRLANLQKLVINVEIGQDKMESFSYNIKDNQLKIYLTAKAGAIAPDDISTEEPTYKYDLIITLDTPDLEGLGSIFEKSPEFFYNTNIINIDHRPDNEQYGQINLIDFNAVATAEVLFNLLQQLNNQLLDDQIATCLLTGLITKTKSFQTPSVTPKTLDIAGQLMILDADRQTIIKSLYRSRSLATLNLWGRVLTRLRQEQNQKLVWSVVTERDFLDSSAQEADLDDVIDELIAFIPDVEVAILIYDYNKEIKVLVRTLKKYNALYLTKDFSATGSKNNAAFILPEQSLAEAEKIVSEKIKEKMQQNVI